MDSDEESSYEENLAQRALKPYLGKIIALRLGLLGGLTVCRLLAMDNEWLMVDWLDSDGAVFGRDCLRFENVTSIRYDGVELDRMKLATAFSKEDNNEDN